MAWYSKGVRFECQRCGHCCGGEPGNVFISPDDVQRIASHLCISSGDFLSQYCREVDMGSYYQTSLKEREDYSCIFLTDKGCAIYEVRPLQCRTYPFWPYIFSDRALLEAEKAQCPGIGKGEVHDETEIRTCLSAMTREKVVTRVK